MDLKVRKYLEDIRLSIEEIESFLQQRPRQYKVFVEDHMFRNAIERQLGIIGEAVSQILKIDSGINITYAHKIRSTRNYIIHSYDTLDLPTLWSIVINHLPLLKVEINSLLENQEEDN